MVKVYTYRGGEGESVSHDVEEVIFAAGVFMIWSYAFCNCTRLVSVPPFPSALASIGWYSFGHCSSLVHIVIPDGIRVNPYAIANCTALEAIAASSNVKVNDYFRASHLAHQTIKMIKLRVAVLLSLKVYQQVTENNNPNNNVLLMDDPCRREEGDLNGPLAYRKLTFGYNEMWREVLKYV